METMRRFAPDPAAFDEFTHQWFFKVVLPDYRLHDPRKIRDGDRWTVTVRLENSGSGTMPVEVAAIRGERFDAAGANSSDYRETRASATLGRGESRDITLVCPFEPESIVVDPDAMVLQLERKSAVVKF